MIRVRPEFGCLNTIDNLVGSELSQLRHILLWLGPYAATMSSITSPTHTSLVANEGRRTTFYQGHTSSQRWCP
jgi:hypothetical protein